MLQHLGIIADGNRRWAKEHGLSTIEGHKKGLEKIEMLVGEAMRAKIPYITFYVFSTENWGRSKDEVDYIMKLAMSRIAKLADKMARNNARLVFLGTKTGVDPRLASLIEEAEQKTKNCDGIIAGFCFNYGGEQEIVDAANKIVKDGGKITPKTIRENIYHPEIPDIDMVVRTSGEERISGFMLWRAAYAEFLFLKKYFPEMEASDLQEIIKEYENRNRRFGK